MRFACVDHAGKSVYLTQRLLEAGHETAGRIEDTDVLLLDCDWPRPPAYAFALAQIARRSGDRERDLAPELLARVAQRLAGVPGGERLALLVREVVELEEREQARLLDESLPGGLRLAAPS
jgi:hypothetical protein